MSMYKFTVASIDSRTVNTKNGPKPVYDLIGTDGTKYQLGFTNPSRSGITVGTEVACEGETDRWGIKLDAKRILTGAAAAMMIPTATAPMPATASGSVGGVKNAGSKFDRVFPVPTTHGDMAIIRQNALTNAVATVADWVATQNADKWPTLEEWRKLVIESAYDYAKFSSGQREVEAVNKLTAAGLEAADITKAVQAHLNATDSNSEEEAG